MKELLESERIFLRALEPEDLDVLYQWENDPGNWKISNTLIPFSKHTLQQYIQHSSADLYEIKQLRLMIIRKEDKHALGVIDLFDFDPYHKRGGIGILIQESEDRTRGYAGEALRIFMNYCFSYLKMHQLYCNIAPDNTASIRLFTGNGFRIIGEKKEWNAWGDAFRGELMLQYIHLPENSSS